MSFKREYIIYLLTYTKAKTPFGFTDFSLEIKLKCSFSDVANFEISLAERPRFMAKISTNDNVKLCIRIPNPEQLHAPAKHMHRACERSNLGGTGSTHSSKEKHGNAKLLSRIS